MGTTEFTCGPRARTANSLGNPYGQGTLKQRASISTLGPTCVTVPDQLTQSEPMRNEVEAGTSASSGTPRELLLWHPALHVSRDGCRLSFWRLAFPAPYERDRTFDTLHKLYEDFNIESYVEYELLGDWDVLLRLWLPSGLDYSELDAALSGAFGLRNIDYFLGREVLHQSERVDYSIDDSALEHPQVELINQYNDEQIAAYLRGTPTPEQRPQDAQSLEEQKLLKPVDLSRRGIRMLITFTHPNISLSPPTREWVKNQLLEVCKEIDREWGDPKFEHPAAVSLHVGSGSMTEFLLFVRAPHRHFHAFAKDLTGARLPSLGLHTHGMRAYTTVLADEIFHDARERLSIPTLRIPTERELVNGAESERFELKSTFALNLRRYRSTGEVADADEIRLSVVKAVCGFINAPRGGVTIIGVLEAERELQKITGKGMHEDRGLEYLQWIKEMTGVDAVRKNDGTLANVILGIEIETGPGLVYEDRDTFERAVEATLRSQIEPNPMPFVSLAIVEVASKHVAVLSARPSSVWHFVRDASGTADDFYVREGVSTRLYGGVERELYQRFHARGDQAKRSWE